MTPDEVDKANLILQPEFLPEFKEHGSNVVRCPLPWLSAEALELQQKLEEEASKYAKLYFAAPRDYEDGSPSELPPPKDAAQWAVTREGRLQAVEESVEEMLVEGDGVQKEQMEEKEEDEGDELVEEEQQKDASA